MKKNVRIIGVGSCLPENIITNNDIKEMGIDTSDEWIKSRTGIEQRRIAENNESTSTFATKAAEKAINHAKISAEEIDLIIVCTSTPDHLSFPNTACLVQKNIKAKNAAAFDLSAACTGFVYGMVTATQFIENNSYNTILLIGAETMSKSLNWEDRNTCVLFGDGAGAVILKGSESPEEGVVTWTLGADGTGDDYLIIPNGGSKNPLTEKNISEKNHFITMKGKQVFKFAVNAVGTSIEKCLEQSGLTNSDIDFVILHQANKRIIDYAAERFGLSTDQVYVNIGQYGNTSAASIPIALDEAVQENKLKKGDLIAATGFGAGLTWGTIFFRW